MKEYKNFVEPKKAEVIEEILEEEPKTPSIGIVNCDALNIRKEPSKESQIIRILKRNDSVEIIEEVDNWYQIAPEGYVVAEFIK